MKKLIFVVLATFLFSLSAQAQDVSQTASSILSSVLSKKSAKKSSSTSTNNVVNSIFNFLTGTKDVSANSLVGTWVYSEPAAAFESNNLLSKAGGAVIANQLQNKSASALAKYGIKPGAMKMTFSADSTFTCTVGKKTLSGTYAVEGTDVLFYKGGVKVLSSNVNLKSSSMQLTFQADKLLTFVKLLNGISSVSSSLKLITTLANNYDGMQLGMQFAKE
ncbi:MAG: DUF4923 family protein [Bacteroidaceae bacterium]|nr:DUF4923 family protein [Bacteroidaceae bacterium]